VGRVEADAHAALRGQAVHEGLEQVRLGLSRTFDDGIQDQYTLAYPELKKSGLRATFGIIGSKVGGTIKATGEPEVPNLKPGTC
jgi:hypothetical protein